MKKLFNKKNILILLLIILVFVFLLFVNNYIGNIKNKNVELNTIHNNGDYAIYLEKSPNSGEYEASNTIPLDEYTLNTKKSGCVNNNGIKIDVPLLQVEDNVEVLLGSSASCYLYYNMDALPQTQNLNEYLINRGDMWQSGLEGDGYRFTGSGSFKINTSPNNFICFGTDSKKTCISNKEKYLYRVIGVFYDELGVKHTKIIKYTSLNKNYSWNTSPTKFLWSKSDLSQGLNGSTFANNTQYEYLQDKSWLKKINLYKWLSSNTAVAGNVDYQNNASASTIYLQEMNHPSKPDKTNIVDESNAKIGITSVSDYMLSLGAIALNYNGDNTNLINGWMHLSNNNYVNNELGYTKENTISRSSQEMVYTILENGLIGKELETEKKSTRPNMYLEDNVMYLSGVGTITSPIIVDNYVLPKLEATFEKKVISLKISKNDFKISSYCINESSTDLTSCTWINDTLTGLKINFNKEGLFYVHLKDLSGRIITSNKIDTVIDDLVGVFKYTGKEETIVSKFIGTYFVEGQGAAGKSSGGLGAGLKVALKVNKGDIIKLKVGGQECKLGGGLDSTGKCTNGGGDSSQIYINDILVYAASGGGGGKDGTDGNTTTSSTNGIGGASYEGDAAEASTITIIPKKGYDGINGSGGGAGNFYQNCSKYDGPYDPCKTGSNTCQPGYVNSGTCNTYGNYTSYSNPVSSCSAYGSAGTSSSYTDCSNNGYTKYTTTNVCTSYGPWSSWSIAGWYYDYQSGVSNNTYESTFERGYARQRYTRSCNSYKRCDKCSCATYNSCPNKSICGCESYKSCSNTSCGCASWNKKCVRCLRGGTGAAPGCRPASNNRCVEWKNTSCARYYSCRDSSCGCAVSASCPHPSCGCAIYKGCSSCDCADYTGWSWESNTHSMSCSGATYDYYKYVCETRYRKSERRRSCSQYTPQTTSSIVSSCSPSSNVSCEPNYIQTTYYGSCISYNQEYSSCATGSNTCVGGQSCSVAGEVIYKSGKGGKNYINSTYVTIINESTGVKTGNGIITITK